MFINHNFLNRVLISIEFSHICTKSILSLTQGCIILQLCAIVTIATVWASYDPMEGEKYDVDVRFHTDILVLEF